MPYSFLDYKNPIKKKLIKKYQNKWHDGFYCSARCIKKTKHTELLYGTKAESVKNLIY